MKNKKGFTLVEILVAIIILGIITGISIPLISNIKVAQRTKQFDTYRNSLEAGAKLYNSSYSIDLFGKRQSGCAIVSYSDLIKKNYIKEIKMKNISCGEEDESGKSETYVLVTKYAGNYYYNSNLICRTSSGERVYPYDNSELISCPGEGEASINVKADPSKKGNYDAKKVSNIKVMLESATGFSTTPSLKPKVEYLFTTHATLQDSDYTANWELISSSNNISSESSQLKKIENGEIVNYFLGNLEASDLSGDVYLFVRTKELYNLQNSKWTPGSGWETKEDYHYKNIGVYKIDNEKPTVSIINITSNNAAYNALNAMLNTNASDNKTKKANLKMCVSIDTSACSNYVKYTSPTNVKFGTKYDGSTHNAYIRVKDLAGNISTQKKSNNYVVANENTLTYNSDGGSACNPTSKKEIKGNKWGTLCSPTRTGYTFGGWYTSKNGGGTRITADSVVTNSLTVYAKWNSKQVTVTFNCNGGTGGGSQTFTYGASGQKFSKTCTKAGSTQDGWKLKASATSRNYTTASSVSNDWINKNSPKITLYAHWAINKVTCTAGNYLKKAGTSCTKCPANKYCPGGTYTYSTTADQGINNCPSGYGNSAAGSDAANDCYMKVPANNYVKTAKASSTACAKGYEKAAHNVYYGKTSSCTAKKVTVTFNCNKGTGGGSQTFTYGTSGQQFSKTCKRDEYVQIGWIINKSSSEKDYNVAANVSDNFINSKSPSITLYALWMKPPTCKIKITNTPEQGEDDWYRQKVKIELSTTGTISTKGLDTSKKSTNNKTTATIDEEGTTTYYGFVKNAAGSDSCSIKIKLDMTPPQFVSKYKTYNGGYERANRLGYYFKDNLSGYIPIGTGSSYMKYCYNRVNCDTWLNHTYYCKGATKYNGSTASSSTYLNAHFNGNLTRGKTDKALVHGGVAEQCYPKITSKWKACDIAGNCTDEKTVVYEW